MDIETIHPTDILHRFRRMDFAILRLPFGFDEKRLQTALFKATALHPWVPKDGETLYGALGLQYSDPQNPYSDSISMTSFTRAHSPTDQKMIMKAFRFYPHWNAAGEEFRFVADRLTPLRLFRGRLLRAEPGYAMKEAHIDGRGSVRVHVPIESNPDAWFNLDGKRYHLPADGSAYLINTARPHRIGNDGHDARTHAVFLLYPNSLYFFDSVASDAYLGWIETVFAPDYQVFQNAIVALEARSNGRCQLCNSAQSDRLLCSPENPNMGDVLSNGADALALICKICLDGVGRSSKSVSDFYRRLEIAWSAQTNQK